MTFTLGFIAGFVAFPVVCAALIGVGFALEEYIGVQPMH